MSTAPLSSSIHQLRASCSATPRGSLWPMPGVVPSATKMGLLLIGWGAPRLGSIGARS
jgi:hypothetical protein